MKTIKTFSNISKKRKKGFTLIELMVVIVIIGILVAIALPNFFAAQDRAKIASIKGNMKTIQMMAETYGTDWGGLYPYNCKGGAGNILKNEAIAKGYWKDITNPFTGDSDTKTVSDAGVLDAFPLASITNTSIPKGSAYIGCVVWATMAGGNAPQTKYAIYGITGKLNEPVKDRNDAFVLSNN